ncbi:MAG: GTP-binding protein [Bacteroidales bacterium]
MTEVQSPRGFLDMSLLRFSTAGSVDDGKSTLIGRLLYDSKSIFEDQLDAIEETSKRRGEEEVNLAYLTDGLRAEREQGITIDVAYRYFATPKRKFIIADTPGHIQYTRNMVTGASTANLAIILIDARNGVLEQTIRHTYIAHLLDIKHIVFAINKMDLVDFSESVYNSICDNIKKIIEKVAIHEYFFIPISAKLGDNVVDASKKMAWYKGNTLLHILETVQVTGDKNFTDPRFPVQYIIRPFKEEYHDYRGYAGRVASGVFKPGDKIFVLPGGIETEIDTIDEYKTRLTQAQEGDCVTITLKDDIDISRGNMFCKLDNQPTSSQEIELMTCWFNERPLVAGNKYIVRHTTNEVKCIVKEINYKMNINTLEQITDDKQVRMNDIARVFIKTTKPLFYDSYKKNRITGSLVFIDEATNETVGAGMII